MAVAVIIVVAVVMRIGLRANVLHLQDVSAFRAALDGPFSGHLGVHVLAHNTPLMGGVSFRHAGTIP